MATARWTSSSTTAPTATPQRGSATALGGLTFAPLLFSSGFTSVRLADYTGDGKADITVYNKNTAAAYFGTGNGAGNFTFQSLFWSPAYDVVEPQDVNGDGKMDIVLVQQHYDRHRVYRHQQRRRHVHVHVLALGTGQDPGTIACRKPRVGWSREMTTASDGIPALKPGFESIPEPKNINEY